MNGLFLFSLALCFYCCQGTERRYHLVDVQPLNSPIDCLSKRIDKQQIPYYSPKRTINCDCCDRSVNCGYSKMAVNCGCTMSNLHSGCSTRTINCGCSKKTVNCGCNKNIVNCGCSKKIANCGCSKILNCGCCGCFEKTIDCGCTKKIVNCGCSKNFVNSGYPKNIVNCGCSKNIVNCGCSKNIVNCGCSKKILNCGCSQRTVDYGCSKNILNCGCSKKISNCRCSQRTVDCGCFDKNIDCGCCKTLINQGFPKGVEKCGCPKLFNECSCPKRFDDYGCHKRFDDCGCHKRYDDCGCLKRFHDCGHPNKVTDFSHSCKIIQSCNNFPKQCNKCEGLVNDCSYFNSVNRNGLLNSKVEKYEWSNGINNGGDCCKSVNNHFSCKSCNCKRFDSGEVWKSPEQHCNLDSFECEGNCPACNKISLDNYPKGNQNAYRRSKVVNLNFNNNCPKCNNRMPSHFYPQQNCHDCLKHDHPKGNEIYKRIDDSDCCELFTVPCLGLSIGLTTFEKDCIQENNFFPERDQSVPSRVHPVVPYPGECMY